MHAPGPMRPDRRVAGLLICIAIAGCRAKGRWSEADELRSQLDAANSRLAAVTAERDEARAKLAEAERVRLGGADLARDAAESLPRCAGVEIDRLTGLDRTGAYVDIYLKPFDGRRRFIQIVGSVNVRIDSLPPAASPPDAPRTLASAVFGPADLREAYRSSMMGTHYTLRLPLAQQPGKGERLAVTVEFLDALTGAIHRAERVIPSAAQ